MSVTEEELQSPPSCPRLTLHPWHSSSHLLEHPAYTVVEPWHGLQLCCGSFWNIFRYNCFFMVLISNPVPLLWVRLRDYEDSLSGGAADKVVLVCFSESGTWWKACSHKRLRTSQAFRIKALELKLTGTTLYTFKYDTHPKICTQIYFSLLLANVCIPTAFASRQVSIFFAFILGWLDAGKLWF